MSRLAVRVPITRSGHCWMAQKVAAAAPMLRTMAVVKEPPTIRFRPRSRIDSTRKLPARAVPSGTRAWTTPAIWAAMLASTASTMPTSMPGSHQARFMVCGSTPPPVKPAGP